MCGGKERSMEQPRISALVCLLQKGKWAFQTSQEASEVLLDRIQEDLQGLKMWARLSEKISPALRTKQLLTLFWEKNAFHFEMLQVVWIYIHPSIHITYEVP